MKNIIQQHRVFFIFLIKFLLCYLLVTLLYSFYLGQFQHQKNEVDGITLFVSEQTRNILVFFGENCEIIKHDSEPSYKVIYNSVYLARIVEGCNAISVIILFGSFVFAFSTKIKTTLLYIFFGSVFIFLLNILRISLLVIGLYKYPKYGTFLHDIVFPLFIYGVVFFLWILWVIKFSINKKQNG